MCQTLVNCCPGVMIVPSGMVSPARLARAQDASPLLRVGKVGLTISVGVKMVGKASGVCVGSGVEDGTASCVFWACTVNATDVAIASSEAAVPQPTAMIDTIVKIKVILRANLLLIRTSFHEAARKASAHYTRYKV